MQLTVPQKAAVEHGLYDASKEEKDIFGQLQVRRLAGGVAAAQADSTFTIVCVDVTLSLSQPAFTPTSHAQRPSRVACE